ncbi:MAG: glycosyltransferase family 4 protein [Polaromonas sp.]|uniref:glycosyltransferase family 4 protein n=1 Tax=Polaromonas sp. TaxID=1869339 RepID=UPI0017EDF323|nr:glycosyltransferase family 4 protein [Polaromonas sp.]NMM11432.1 glycosyltransferase family 4 protein [Polaromonas sp.]
MKSILVIHHGQGVGGGLIALLGLIAELKENNRVHVLSIFDGIAVDYIRQTGATVTVAKSRFYAKFYQLFIHSDAAYFNIIDSIRNNKSVILYYLSKYYFAGKELKNIVFDYEIVYLNSIFISDWARASKLAKKKVVIHVREPLSRGLFKFKYEIIRQTINKYCDQVIAISHDNASRLDLQHKTTVVYDPVVTKNRSQSEYKLINRKFKYFVYLGGMARIKGFEQLVESLEYLDENIRIFFLGGESEYASHGLKRLVRQNLDPFFLKNKRLIDKLKKSGKIIHVGLVDDVFYYYENSIAAICPFSKPHASLPILEAFSVGKPVIVSDVKGMEELVDSTNGVFFINSDPESLAHKINEMSQVTEQDYEAMRTACMTKYKQIRERSDSVTSVLNRT